MSNNEKEFGSVSLQQFKEIFAHLHQVQQYANEISDSSIEYATNLTDLFQHGPPWSHWYELPYNQFLVVMLAGFGLLEIFTEASKHQDPLQVTLDLTENVKDPTDEEIDAYSPEERGYFTSLYFAVLGNISAQRIFNQNLNDLVQQAKADDEALFNAILVDRRCLGCPTIVKRIQLATTQEDESFFNRLSKAITKTRPRRPMEEYDDLRFMLGILETCKTLSEFSSKRLYEVFVDELELYPFFGQHDSFEAFRKFLNRRRNR